MNIQELDTRYVAGTYRRFPITIVSGKGSVVTDEHGKEYIDLGTGIAVNTFGVADDVWQRAVMEQVAKVQHTSNLYYTQPCAELAKELCQRTGMGKVFFSNSGAEANECAIKVARKWAATTLGPSHTVIVTLRGSFHGRTLTTLAATGQDVFHTQFQPLTPGFVHVTPGDVAELEQVFAEHKVAGVLVECIQGEGGVLPLPQSYAQKLEEIAHQHGALLMVDEVQTGNGRTGALYAYMRYGLHPDVVSTAKGLAGGLPLGATLMAENVQDILGPGDHGSTFGGNPVSCAAALSVIRRLDEQLMQDVRAKSEWLFSKLRDMPGVTKVTGLGLMIGIQTVRPASEVVSRCREQGVLCLTAKDKVRLLPALNIPMELLERAMEVFRSACAV